MSFIGGTTVGIANVYIILYNLHLCTEALDVGACCVVMVQVLVADRAVQSLQ